MLQAICLLNWNINVRNESTWRIIPSAFVMLQDKWGIWRSANISAETASKGSLVSFVKVIVFRVGFARQ